MASNRSARAKSSSARVRRLAHFGTFDVENYGDLLFPLIVRARLGDLFHDFVHVSPAGGVVGWQDCVPSISVEEALADGGPFGGVVLGGGHLIHADPASLERYELGGAPGILGYPALWAGAAELAVRARAPLCWNAPGVPRSIRPRSADLLRWSCSIAGYLSVRDRPSLSLLGEAGVDEPVHVVPDVALEVRELWSRAELKDALAAAFRTADRAVPERHFTAHLNARYLDEAPSSVAARLDRIAERLDATPVLIGIGPCHGDDVVQREVGGEMSTSPLVLDRPRSLREVAALIAGSQLYLGSSLHGFITACAFGARAMLVASEETARFRKFTGFLEQFQLTPFLFDTWRLAEESLVATLSVPVDVWASVPETARPMLDRHWEQIRSALTARTNRGAGSGIEDLVSRSGRDAYREALIRHVGPDQLEHLAAGARQQRLSAARARATIRELERKRESARRETDERLRQLETLQQRYDELAELERASRREAEALSESLNQARHEAAERGMMTGQLRTRVQALEGELDEARSGAEQAASEGARVRAELEKRLAGEQAQLASAHTELEHVAAERDRLRTRLDELQQDLTERERSLDALRSQSLQVDAELARAGQRFEAAAAELRVVRQELEQRDAQLESVTSEREQLAERLESHKEALSRRLEKISVLEDRVSDLESRIAAEVREAADRQAVLRRQLETIADLESRISDLESGVAAQGRALDERTGELRAADAELARQRTALSQHEELLGRRTRQLTAAEQHMALMADDLAAVRELLRRVAVSRSWRYGHGTVSALSRLRLRRPKSSEGGVEVALELLEMTESRAANYQHPAGVGVAASDDQAAPAPPERPSRPAPATKTPRAPAARSKDTRPKVSVLAWDVGHNPVGRAYLVAEMLARRFRVELVGAQFPRYGKEVWEPIRTAAIPVRPFPGSEFPEHFHTMERIAGQLDGDAIVACKPRLPSLELAILAKESRNRPLLLDVDDRETSFFAEGSALTLSEVAALSGEEAFNLPHGEAWTRYCETLIPAADERLASNVELQRLYGGLLVPHARDERVFDPAPYDRDEVRREFGFEPGDKVILFIGTPRMHKGLADIGRALEAIGDPAYKLCIIGTPTDRRVEQWLTATGGEHIRLFPNRPHGELARNLMLGDLVCLLQDPGSEVSKYQIPAKLTDALAMGIPVLANAAPPLAPFAKRGLIELVGDAPLAERIVDIFRHHDELRERASADRSVFLEELSYEALAPTLAAKILTMLEAPAEFPESFRELLRFHRATFGTPIAPRRAIPSTSVGGQAEPRPRSAVRAATAATAVREVPRGRSPRAPTGGAVVSRGTPAELPRRAAAHRRPAWQEGLDIVFFWKQNDSGIYGRRSDMMVKYLERLPGVNQIVHFDAPISARALANTYKRGHDARIDQSQLVFWNTVRRLMGVGHRGKTSRYTFVHADGDGGRRSKLGGVVLPTAEEHLGYVARTLAKHGIGKRPTVLWVCPRNFAFTSVADALRPDLVVADVIDDHRTWVAAGSAHHTKLTENYREILSRSDLVYANCEQVRDAMAQFAPSIRLLTNASEPPDVLAASARSRRRPRELRRLAGPIIGYSGNLSSRIDIDLLEHVARSRPEWNLVLIGSAHLSRDVLRLDELENVHFLGVKPYRDALAYINAFDVGIIPHLDNEMTRAMNPLKAFVYAGLNVPVVSTPVANLGDLASLIHVAHTRGEFVRSIDAILAAPRDVISSRQLEVLRANSWPQRVDTVMRDVGELLVDQG